MSALQVVVLSNDSALRREVEAALAGTPVRLHWTSWERAWEMQPSRRARIVVIDDDGCADALAVVRWLRADERDSHIVYLAAHHSIEHEREVRQAGVSYYADKSARDRGAVRAIEAILRASGVPIEPEQRGDTGVVQPGFAAREEKRGCAS